MPKKTTTKVDRPADLSQVIDDEDWEDEMESELSDVYELRTCRYCDTFLPLFSGAKLVTIDTGEDFEEIAVCDTCYIIRGHGD